MYADNEEIELDEEKAKRIIRRIVEAENENVKTKAKNDEDMKKEIAKIIEEEIKCY